MDLTKNENLKATKNIDVRTKAKRVLSSNDITQAEELEFQKYIQKCFVAAASHLQIKLTLNNKVIEEAQYLHPERRSGPCSTNAISNLALMIAKTFAANQAQTLFNVSSETLVDDIVDKVRRHQWVMYKMNDIPDTYLL